MFPKRYADQVAKQRVFAGFLLVATFAWFSHPNARSLVIGLPVALLGLCLRAWAAGNLAKDSTLATEGPYTLVRNPLYLGTLTAAAGFAIASASWPLALVFAAVFLLIYLPVIDLEEQHLRDIFPAFPAYAATVPRLLPSIRITNETQAFRFALYRKNREYEAGLGFLAGAALLIFKSI
jgi:protein-S-isoprenylcysteine O-methyltransferase Ste14